jgi:hypothetical protein
VPSDTNKSPVKNLESHVFEALSRLRLQEGVAVSPIPCKLIGASGLDSVSPRLGGR